ncbi:hypothetical protein D5275_06180 [Adlercreutzia muris]|nr:hypothetical protein [Adlercreutzia muris]
MNAFQRIANSAQELERLALRKTSREFYRVLKSRTKMGKLKMVFFLFLLAALILFLISRLHIIWLIH